MGSIVYAGVTVEGTILDFEIPPAEPNISTFRYPGIIGETAIHAGFGGRLLNIPVVIHHADYEAASDIEELFTQLDEQTNAVSDTLTVTTSTVDTFPDCVLLGAYRPRGGIRAPSGTITGYWTRATLLFRQLRHREA